MIYAVRVGKKRNKLLTLIQCLQRLQKTLQFIAESRSGALVETEHNYLLASRLHKRYCRPTGRDDRRGFSKQY